MQQSETIDNTKEIAHEIFTKEVRPANSIQLFLEEQTADLATRTDANKFINEVLSVITMHGIEILYGHRDIALITKSQADRVYDYVKSYGYEIKNKGNGPEFVRLRQ